MRDIKGGGSGQEGKGIEGTGKSRERGNHNQDILYEKKHFQ